MKKTKRVSGREVKEVRKVCTLGDVHKVGAMVKKVKVVDPDKGVAVQKKVVPVVEVDNETVV